MEFMYDRIIVIGILEQIDTALDTILARCETVHSVGDLTNTPPGKERLDGLCMLFMAIGEALKNIEKITSGSLLHRYPKIDWKGAMGFRDILAHHYFDIDAEMVFWICQHQLVPLSDTIKTIVRDFRDN
jgi:uncharacterized protein with HEPN domain